MLTIIWEQSQDMSVLSSLKWFRNHEQKLYLRKRGGLVVKNYIAVLEAVEGMCIFFCGCMVCYFVVKGMCIFFNI